MYLIRTFIKFLSSKILTLKFSERLSQNIIRRNIIAQKNPKIVSTAAGNPKSFKINSWNEILRYKVWKKIPEYIDTSKDILYLEFGVWEGHSIKFFAEKYKSKNSEFYGFDTFYGFPEDCLDMKKGHYSTSGDIPKTSDPRIKFIKGLFQETLTDFLEKLATESKKKTVLKRLKKRANYDSIVLKSLKENQIILLKKRKLAHYIVDNNYTENIMKKKINSIKKEILYERNCT